MKRLLVVSVLMLPLALAACASGGGGGSGVGSGGGGTTSPPPPPPPPPPPSPPPPPAAFSIGAPAAGTYGTLPPTSPAAGFQTATAGGANFGSTGPGPAPGVVFALNQTALSITSTAIVADTATNASGITATVVDSGTAEVEVKIPSLGVDQNLSVEGGPDTKLSNGKYLRVTAMSTNPSLTYALLGDWQIDDATDTVPLEAGAFVGGYHAPASAIPTSGTGSFVDAFGVQGEAFYPKASGSLPFTEASISGSVNLSVNFASGAVSGDFNNLDVISGATISPWNTLVVSGQLSSGNITGTTTLANPQSNSFAFGSGSGTISGGFYGPSAQEVAGIWTVTDGTNSAIGTFGAPTSPPGPPIVLPASIGAPERATVGTTPPTTTAQGQELATAGGANLISVDGGADTTEPGTAFALTQSTLKITATSIAADTATDAAGTTLTSTEVGLGQVELKSPNLGVDGTTRFTPNSTTLPDGRVLTVTSNTYLDYVVLGSWEIDGDTANPTSAFSEFAAGYQTPAASLPTGGTATYSQAGGAVGTVFAPPSSQSFGSAAYQSYFVTGDVSLVANFGTGSITGALTNMTAGSAGAPESAASGGVTWNDVSLTGTISGDTFTGTAATTTTPLNSAALGAATGTLSGGFYGPTTDEVGGVWTLYDGTKAAMGTFGAPMTSESGLSGGLQVIACCGASPDAVAGSASFMFVNTGTVPVGDSLEDPFDNTLIPFTEETVSGPGSVQLGGPFPPPVLDFVHTDPATGAATLDLDTGSGDVDLTNLGPGPSGDADPAELYSGSFGGITYDVTLRHLNWVAFGLWSDASVTGAWVGGYVTPTASKPTSGAGTFSGETYGVVDATVNSQTEQATLKGDVSLTVNADLDIVAGELANMTVTAPGGTAQTWNNVLISATLSGVAFNGTTAVGSAATGPFAAQMGAVGQVNGGLFGPAFQEIGATWSLADGNIRAVGSLGGTLQPDSGGGDGVIAVSTGGGGTITVFTGNQASAGGPVFTGINAGPLPGGVTPPTDGTAFGFTEEAVSGPGSVQLNAPAALLVFDHVDPTTGQPSLTLEVGSTSVSLTDLGAGPAGDQAPAELYSGMSGGQTFQLSLRHLDWLAFGVWSEPGLTSGWISGYTTPTGGVPTSGTANYAGATYGVVDATVGAATEQASLTGAANLNVDFGQQTITGSLTNMVATAPDASTQPWNNVSVTGTLSGASFTGTTAAANAPGGTFSASGTATGETKGGFYGPTAEELGAVWSLSDGTVRAVGAIGAKKQ